MEDFKNSNFKITITATQTAIRLGFDEDDIREFVATMEDNNELSESISVKIKDVSKIAGKTSSDVRDGVTYLEENVRQLHEIADASRSLATQAQNMQEVIAKFKI